MDTEKETLENARSLYKTVLRWYENADTKAKILLTLDGALVSFLTSSVFVKRQELDAILRAFGHTEPFALGVMGFAMALSILSALACLWSRVRLPKPIKNLIEQTEGPEEWGKPYPLELVLFFGFIRRLDRSRFHNTLAHLTPAREVEALAYQIHALSNNVFKKHVFVNIGFVLFGISLIAFLVAGVAYLL